MLMAVLGAIIVLLALADFIETTLSVRGAGFITNKVTRWLWRPMGLWRWLPSRLAAVTGPMALMLALVLWLGLTWAGWSLIFSTGADAVVHSTTGRSATLLERIYFVGFTISTLGVGDFVPGSDLARVLSILAAFNGFTVITLSITYFLSVVNSVTQSHALAREIHSLGHSGEEMVANSWNGKDFTVLISRFDGFTTELFKGAEQRRSFPITNYFASRGESSLADAITVLNEAVLLLGAGVARSAQPHPAILRSLGKALSAIIPDAVGHAEQKPSPPSRKLLIEAGVPLSEEADYLAAVHAAEPTRAALRSWQGHQGN